MNSKSLYHPPVSTSYLLHSRNREKTHQSATLVTFSAPWGRGCEEKQLEISRATVPVLQTYIHSLETVVVSYNFICILLILSPPLIAFPLSMNPFCVSDLSMSFVHDPQGLTGGVGLFTHVGSSTGGHTIDQYLHKWRKLMPTSLAILGVNGFFGSGYDLMRPYPLQNRMMMAAHLFKFCADNLSICELMSVKAMWPGSQHI